MLPKIDSSFQNLSSFPHIPMTNCQTKKVSQCVTRKWTLLRKWWPSNLVIENSWPDTSHLIVLIRMPINSTSWGKKKVDGFPNNWTWKLNNYATIKPAFSFLCTLQNPHRLINITSMHPFTAVGELFTVMENPCNVFKPLWHKVISFVN